MDTVSNRYGLALVSYARHLEAEVRELENQLRPKCRCSRCDPEGFDYYAHNEEAPTGQEEGKK